MTLTCRPGLLQASSLHNYSLQNSLHRSKPTAPAHGQSGLADSNSFADGINSTRTSTLLPRPVGGVSAANANYANANVNSVSPQSPSSRLAMLTLAGQSLAAAERSTPNRTSHATATSRSLAALVDVGHAERICCSCSWWHWWHWWQVLGSAHLPRLSSLCCSDHSAYKAMGHQVSSPQHRLPSTMLFEDEEEAVHEGSKGTATGTTVT